jgi:hypothetical protein
LVAALAAGSLIAGCGSSSTPSTPTATPVKTSTTTAAKPKHAGKPHAPAHGHKAPAKHAPAKPKPKPKPVIKVPKRQVVVAGGLLKTLSGTGNAAIGSLDEKTAVVLEWSTTAAPIEIFNSHGFFLVNSHSPTGKVRLSAGKYTNLHVSTKGHWTIELHASG